MSTRASSSKRPLSSLESLLLAQAAWELGAGPDAWAPIAKILAKHTLLSRPKAFFTPQVRIFLFPVVLQVNLSSVVSRHVRGSYERGRPRTVCLIHMPAYSIIDCVPGMNPTTHPMVSPFHPR